MLRWFFVEPILQILLEVERFDRLNQETFHTIVDSLAVKQLPTDVALLP